LFALPKRLPQRVYDVIVKKEGKEEGREREGKKEGKGGEEREEGKRGEKCEHRQTLNKQQNNNKCMFGD
jgi:hypothetical protein